MAAVAALIGEPARAAILDALLDGGGLPASELARRAGVTPSTASAHLSRLAAGGLLACEPAGRERRYRLASPDVAEALETLARIAPRREVRSLRGAGRAEAIRAARTCYDHLAGRLGVGLTEALVARDALVLRGAAYDLTASGESLLADLGVDVASARGRRRAFTRACLDWTERRPHLAGALGAALADALLEAGWVERRPADRGLRVTPAGRRGLARLGVAA